MNVIERKSWFRVSTKKTADGRFDVVLRIDGTYTSEHDAERLAEYFAEELDCALALE